MNANLQTMPPGPRLVGSATLLTDETTSPVTVPGQEAAAQPRGRLRVDGKFLALGGKRFWVKGVTYGTFAPDADGFLFPKRDVVERDFFLMALRGFNAVRVYTVPPRWLLDCAQQQGLAVMVGLPWEQHIAFLDDARRRAAIIRSVREGVKTCTGHPAVLCYSIGNEIPAPICRWHGPRRIERFLRRLYEEVKAGDPEALVTYVNFPSTEYLRLHFLDFITFNVYLEQQEKLEGYLARLQNLAGDKPLVMAEIGLDSRRNGDDAQAQTLDWQVRTTLAAGCCGAFVFSWTDEWWRGGHDILDWDFGLVTRERQPKPALVSVARAFAETPFPARQNLPRITVIVCSFNGARTLPDTFAGLHRVDYPNFDVVLVDDGSTDTTAEIGRAHGARVISTENRGLSAARNTGLEAATGEIVVYLDDDAWPDPLWLRYIAETFLRTEHAAVGGPNLAPPATGEVADCVDNAPGGPVHVLIDDRRAEHVPGCNMAFRRSRLVALGGFDAQFRAAGDDVDLCWRLLERGWTIGFHPAAMVWHHRRKTVGAYWRQQRGYGKAEALLERKWPEKYNILGHVAWGGRLYGKGLTRVFGRTSRIYHGTWGSAAFQARYDTPMSLVRVLPTMPEWYLVVLGLALISAMTVLWPRLAWFIPLFTVAASLTIAQAILSADQARFSTPARGLKLVKLRAVTAWLHLIQPAARLWGRLRHGLHAGRLRLPVRMALPFARTLTLWREHWQAPEEKIRRLAVKLRHEGAVIMSGGDYDRWDIAVRGGLFAGARVLMTVEEHGAGRQMFRFVVLPKYTLEAWITFFVLAALTMGSVLDGAAAAYVVFLAFTLVLGFRTMQEAAVAVAAVEGALSEPFDADPSPPGA